jgi:CRP-like cAMP-binding protein
LFSSFLVVLTRELPALKAQRFIESCLLLAPLSPFERSALIDALEVHEFRDGECVIRQGQASGTPFFFFVESGRARVTRFSGEPASSPVLAPAVMPALPPALIAGPPSPREEEVGVIGPGGFFGEVSILTGRPRTANVYALGPLTCLVVPPTAFSELIWRNCSDAMRKESARYRFSASFHPPPTPTLAPGPKAASPLVRSTSSPLE